MKILGAIALFLLLAGCTPTFLGGAGSGSSVPEESAASENRLSEHLSLLVHSDQAMAYYSLLDADVDLYGSFNDIVQEIEAEWATGRQTP